MQLRTKDQTAIINIANATFGEPVKIWAYGSRVKGLAHETSDLDLVVISETAKPVKLSALNRFKELLQDSQLPILVQVVDWYQIPESFRLNIKKDYVELL